MRYVLFQYPGGPRHLEFSLRAPEQPTLGPPLPAEWQPRPWTKIKAPPEQVPDELVGLWVDLHERVRAALDQTDMRMRVRHLNGNRIT